MSQGDALPVEVARVKKACKKFGIGNVRNPMQLHQSKHRGEKNKQCGKEAQSTSNVEALQIDVAGFEPFGEKQACDQKSAKNEEQKDAETAQGADDDRPFQGEMRGLGCMG